MFSLSIKKLFWTCLWIEFSIVVMDLCFNYLKWIPFRSLRKVFNITREDGLGNWFSSLQALLVGATLWAIYSLVKNRKEVEIRLKRGWAILAGFFIFIAIDDATMFHERVGTSFKGVLKTAGSSDSSIWPSYSWQVFLGPVFAGVGLYLLWFLWRSLKTRELKAKIFIAFGLYTIAVGLDVIEGAKEYEYVIAHFMKSVEEFLEMLGTTYFWIVFLQVLKQELKNVDSVEKGPKHPLRIVITP